MATELKSRGMWREADIPTANVCLPDYIGFVFVTGAKRAVSPEIARELRGVLGSQIWTVGISVDQSPREIAKIVAQAPLDCIRLHGDENEESLKRVRALTGKPVWRALQATGSKVLVRAEESRADLLFFGSGEGSGKTFAWEWLRDFSRPHMPAGGLNTKNVDEATKTLSPRRVNVSSTLETDGQKDLEKTRAFAEAARRASSGTERQNYGAGDRERQTF